MPVARFPFLFPALSQFGYLFVCLTKGNESNIYPAFQQDFFLKNDIPNGAMA